MTSAPRDAGYDRPERRRWRAWVAGLAHALDRIYDLGRGALPESQVVFHAFRAFLPLADPGWWRAHPPRKLNSERRRRLRSLRRRLRRAARGRPKRADRRRLAAALYDAIVVYARAGDADGLERCLRLSEAIEVSPAGAGPDRRPARRGPAPTNDGLSRHDAGRETRPGKEAEV